MTATDTIPAKVTVTDPELSELASKARSRSMLVALEVTVWSGRKHDKRVTADTNARYGATAGASRTNKVLLGDKEPFLAACVASASAARTMLYAETFAWSDGVDGQRLLATTNYMPLAEKVRAASADFHTKVSAFLAEYPRLVAEAQSKLNGMYDPSDYPSVDEIRRKFQFRFKSFPVPSASDIRLDLPEDVLASMQRALTARVERATAGAVREGWERLYSSVSRVVERLREVADTPKGRLHDVLFENAIETAEALKRMNVLDDPNLDAMADRVISELSAIDTKAARQDLPGTASQVESILDAMGGIFA